MDISQSRFKAFWNNPEKYRLTYEVGLVPKVSPYGLQRGTAFHEIAHARAGGLDDGKIMAILYGNAPNLEGRVLKGLTKKAIDNAWVLWRAWEGSGYDDALLIEEHEIPFTVEIPGSPHRAIGIIDRVVVYQNDRWVHEFKTAYAKQSHDKTLNDWKVEKQADFELMGAESLGLKSAGLLVSYILESVPPKIWLPIEVKRSEHQIRLMQMAIHQTAETIQMYRETFGIEQPWPHLNNWPCNDAEKCEYSAICGRQHSTLTQIDLEGFVPREPHPHFG